MHGIPTSTNSSTTNRSFCFVGRVTSLGRPLLLCFVGALAAVACSSTGPVVSPNQETVTSGPEAVVQSTDFVAVSKTTAVEGGDIIEIDIRTTMDTGFLMQAWIGESWKSTHALAAGGFDGAIRWVVPIEEFDGFDDQSIDGRASFKMPAAFDHFGPHRICNDEARGECIAITVVE